jgi:hypothetical protein
MTEVIVSKSIQVPASKAWEKLSSFRGIEEYSPIEKSETNGNGAGSTRTCYLPDGAAIHEELVMVDDATMEMQYIITEGPFPISGYRSTVKISPTGEESCKVTWGCEFECSSEVEGEMVKLFEGFYNVIIDSLGNLIRSEN